MKSSFLWVAISLLTSVSSFAQFSTLSFWKQRRPFLKFTTGAQTVFVQNCSAVVTVQAVKASNVAVNLTSPLTVNLSAAGVTFYSDANCATQITSVTINTGTTTANFYFVASGTGSSVVTASATNYSPVSQSETTNTNPYIWTGGGANANWSTAANWSGGAAPGSGNQAIFSSTCVSNCSPTISASMSIGGVRMLSGFTGTITQAASQTMTVNSAGWYQEAGTFVGSASAITFNGPYTLANGSYTSSTGTNTVGSSFTVSGGTFSAASSSYVFNNRGTISIGSNSFNDVSLTPGNGATYTIAGTLLVNGNLTLSNSTDNVALNGGTVEAKKDVFVSNYGFPGTALLKLTGTGTQNFTSTALASRNLPSVEIAATGTVNLSGNLYIGGNYTFTSAGAFNAGTSTIYFPSSTLASMGNVTYYNVGWGSTSSITFLTDVNVSHNLTFSANLSNAGSVYGPGKIKLQGDLILSSSGVGGSSNVVVELMGSGNQNISQGASAISPSITVNSTGGAVTFPASFTFSSCLTYLQGTISGLTTSIFGGSSTCTLTPGNYSFNDVTFAGANGTFVTISGTMTIAGNLTFAAPGNATAKGTIDLYGNLTMTSYYSIGNAINFRGSANQTISHSAVYAPCEMTNLNVNKSGGLVSLISAVDCGGYTTFNLTSGNLDMNSKTFLVKAVGSLNGNTVTKNGGTFYVGGNPISSGSAFGGTIAP